LIDLIYGKRTQIEEGMARLIVAPACFPMSNIDREIGSDINGQSIPLSRSPEMESYISTKGGCGNMSGYTFPVALSSTSKRVLSGAPEA
jgi:hypothetical protein